MTVETSFAGRRVVVMGLGRFGGGIGVTRWLCQQGAEVIVTDLADETALAGSLDALKGLEIRYRLGGHDEADLEGCSLLVVSPAVDKKKSEFFKAAVARGIPWSSEMNLFLERCPGVMVGITGTVGKSTTTAMIGQVLEAASGEASWRHGRVWLGGNIGKSLLDDLPRMSSDDIVILELSSFQLEDAEQVRRSPRIAVVMNVRDNHTDRHGSIAAYAEAKGNIYKYQDPKDWLVLPFEGGVELLPSGWEHRPNVYRFTASAKSGNVRLMYKLDTQDLPGEVEVKLPVPGLHNVENAAVAIAVARILGVPDSVSVDALSRFRGLPHRLEFVGEVDGVRYYNDSKATTPEAAMTSLKAFDRGLVMLMGGSDKGSSFTDVGKMAADRAKAVICMGATRERIRQAVEEGCGSARRPEIVASDDFRGAVEAARRLAAPGDVVCLSPACASFDWFKNYEERGDVFRELVKGWTH